MFNLYVIHSHQFMASFTSGWFIFLWLIDFLFWNGIFI